MPVVGRARPLFVQLTSTGRVPYLSSFSGSASTAFPKTTAWPPVDYHAAAYAAAGSGILRATASDGGHLLRGARQRLATRAVVSNSNDGAPGRGRHEMRVAERRHRLSSMSPRPQPEGGSGASSGTTRPERRPGQACASPCYHRRSTGLFTYHRKTPGAPSSPPQESTLPNSPCTRSIRRISSSFAGLKPSGTECSLHNHCR